MLSTSEHKELDKNIEKIIMNGSTVELVDEKSDDKPEKSEVTSSDRRFITPMRAMSEFLLLPEDLLTLPKTTRRSPYDQDVPITVLRRRDVEAKSIEVWGSRDNQMKESVKREMENKIYRKKIFANKKLLRDYRRQMGMGSDKTEVPGLLGGSGKVILIAIGMNALNLIFKTIAWIVTGSHSMFAEAVHSLADTLNQCILAYGIKKSRQTPDFDHPYGYTNMKYISSLISGVCVFCIGTGLSIYHGIAGMIEAKPLGDLTWGLAVLGFALVTESATLWSALHRTLLDAKQKNITFREYVLRGQDPCVNVVLIEDITAVASCITTGVCMVASVLLESPYPDAVGSLLVGCMLGAIAFFIINQNVGALVGRSIPEENLEKINAELESDSMIRAIHDVKGIDMGNYLVRYKAEMDFDGRELSRAYLDSLNLYALLEEVKSFQATDEVHAFILVHGEAIVDLIGGEIDRIEMKLRKKFPEVRHCDLEIL